jgi:hypothetical protein
MRENRVDSTKRRARLATVGGNDERGTMNDELKASGLSFIIPHSSFIVPRSHGAIDFALL